MPLSFTNHTTLASTMRISLNTLIELVKANICFSNGIPNVPNSTLECEERNQEDRGAGEIGTAK